jgi:hypothetical protein
LASSEPSANKPYLGAGNLSIIEHHVPEADFWGISVTSGDPLLIRFREVIVVGWRIIGLSSDELVSNSTGS